MAGGPQALAVGPAVMAHSGCCGNDIGNGSEKQYFTFHLDSARMVGISNSCGFHWIPSGIPGNFPWIPSGI